MVCIIGSWVAKGKAEIEALIHTEAGIVVPETWNLYSTGGYDGSAFKFIQTCSKRLRDQSPKFTGFLEAKMVAGDLYMDEDTMFSTPHHCTPNRYLTILKLGKDLATCDPTWGTPRLNLVNQFNQPRDTDAFGISGGHFGTWCWADDYMRKMYQVPTLLPQFENMERLMNHVLLPLMALAHCDAIKDDPAKYVVATEGWVNACRQLLQEGDDAVLQFWMHGFTLEQRKNIADKAGLVLPVAEGDGSLPAKRHKKLQKMLAADLKVHSAAADERAE